jgi:hypothetical protein
LNFLCQSGSHQSTIYCQILIFIFLNVLNQFLVISGRFGILFSLLLFFEFFLFFSPNIYFWFFWKKKLNLGNNPKMSYDTYEATYWLSSLRWLWGTLSKTFHTTMSDRFVETCNSLYKWTKSQRKCRAAKKKLALTLHKHRRLYKTRLIKQGQVIVFF